MAVAILLRSTKSDQFSMNKLNEGVRPQLLVTEKTTLYNIPNIVINLKDLTISSCSCNMNKYEEKGVISSSSLSQLW